MSELTEVILGQSGFLRVQSELNLHFVKLNLDTKNKSINHLDSMHACTIVHTLACRRSPYWRSWSDGQGRHPLQRLTVVKLKQLEPDVAAQHEDPSSLEHGGGGVDHAD
jgi:hypothetical protein